MASVALRFVPPNATDLVRLHIWEGNAADGVFNEIDSTTAIGSYPTWIDHYTTSLAGAINHWFSIQWEDAKGAFSDLSAAMQGDSTSLVGTLVERIMLRDPSANEIVATQTAEYVIAEFMHTSDPYSPLLVDQVSYRQLEGMTLFAMANIMLQSFAVGGGTAASWTVGLVSMKSSTQNSSIANAKELLDAAARMLGLNSGIVAQMIMPEIAGGLSEIVSADISRLQIEVE